MKPETARWIFYIGTALSLLLFLGLTADTHRQIAALTHADRLTDEVVAGKKVWHKYNCNDCHTILGFGSYYGPDLTAVYQRRGSQRIVTAIMTPESVTTWRKMPRLDVSKAEMASLMSFFEWVGNIDTHDWPPQDRDVRARAARRAERLLGEAGDPAQTSGTVAPETLRASVPAGSPQSPAKDVRLRKQAGRALGVGVSTGAELFREMDCFDCHKLGRVGDDEGPELTDVGSRLTPARIDSILTDPEAVDPKAEMPNPELTDSERAELVRFLSSLRGPKEE